MMRCTSTSTDQMPAKEWLRYRAELKRQRIAKAVQQRFVSADEIDRMDAKDTVPPPIDEVNRGLLRAAACAELYAPLPVCTVCDEFVAAELPDGMPFIGEGERSAWRDRSLYRLRLDDLPPKFFTVLRAPSSDPLPFELRRQYDVSSLFPGSSKQVCMPLPIPLHRQRAVLTCDV